MSLWAIADDPSVTNCHFKASEKLIFPDRHSILSLWQRKHLGHHCETPLMATLSWVMVIDHKILWMRRVLFCFISIRVKDWWFDMGYSLHDYSYMKTFIEFLLLLKSNTVSMFAYMNYTKLHLFLIQILFIH